MSETSAPDKFLLWLQEDELNDAEKKVLKAFREGWKADDWPGEIVVPPEGGSAPEKPAEGQTEADWQDAILRAGFLRDLFLGNYGKFDPRRIEICRAWIEGPLDLDYCESRLPLVFSRCIFSEGISLQNAIIPGLILPGCNVRKFKDEDEAIFAQEAKVTASVRLAYGFKANGEVFLNAADIGGQLVCAGGHFEKGLMAQNLKTDEDVLLRNGFKSNGVVNLNGAKISGQLVCAGGHFEKGLMAQHLKANADVNLCDNFRSKGEVFLNGADIGGKLVCDGGHFEKGLMAQNLKTDEDVLLRNGFKSNGEVNLLGADIGGQFVCNGGHFEKGLMAESLKANADVNLRDNFRSKGEVNLLGADIGGQLVCDGGHFEKGLMAENLKTDGNVFLSNGFKSNGVVNLNSADISGQLDCHGGHFEKGLMAQNLKTDKDVLLRNGFKSNGVVNLNSADIGGQLVCAGGHFEKGLMAQNLKTDGNVFLSNGFKSNGEVHLNSADIGGQLDCHGGHFEKGLMAQNLKTDKDVLLHNGFKSNGEVHLNSADIGGQLACDGGHFEKGLMAQNLKTGEDVLLRNGFKSNGVVNLNGAKISGQLVCSDGHFNARVNLNGAKISGSLSLTDAIMIFLDNAEVRGELKGLPKWPKFGSANGFRYQAIEIADENWETGLVWVQGMSGSKQSEFAPQPYEQLMSVYRRMGHTNWARNVGFELEKRRSRAFRDWRRSPWRLWYAILGWTIGYGYKPFRFVSWSVGLIVAGSLLFSSGHTEGVVSKLPPPSMQAPAFLANEWIPSEGEALESQSWKENRKPPPDYLPFNPWIYSLEATFPVLNLGLLEKWHPSNGFLLSVRWVWTFIGTLLLAILALFGAGVLGPRWRSGDEGS